MFPLAAVIAGSAGEISACLFGASFQETGRFLPALIFGAAATLPLTVALTALIADGKPRMTVALTGPLVPLALLGHMLIIPRYGPLGASAVTAFVGFIGMLTVLGLVFLAGGFVIYLFEEWADQGFEFILLGLAALAGFSWLVFRGPVGKAMGSILEGGTGGEDAMLASRVADLEDRLQELSLETQRFLEIEERLEFTERLLAQHTDPARRVGDGQ